ncbi:hypothetical protein CLV74_11860 [Donghicola tyrosinivorans]|uniref:Uncharacterized protein n=1 Tax=Donghicola tyrosinivorans TaxID=1652492 RepID=A0A2T0WEE8_9RHOB|nr:hypothetical protein CLV74_11860 [Donghicola tyrosinivorans]
MSVGNTALRSLPIYGTPRHAIDAITGTETQPVLEAPVFRPDQDALAIQEFCHLDGAAVAHFI